MRHPRPGLLCLAAGWLALVFFFARALAAEPAAETSQATNSLAEQDATYDDLTRARIEEATRMESERRDRDQLEAKRLQVSLGVQSDRAPVWSEVLRTNAAAYHALQQQAAKSPTHTAHCTLCDGRGLMPFCVACSASGKCVRCSGTGFVLGEPCAACRGKGKCFLCFGTGKMPCPFCDDGTVYWQAPPPPRAMPVPFARGAQAMPTRSAPLAAPANTYTFHSATPTETPAPEEIPFTEAVSGGKKPQFVAAVLLIGVLLLHKLVPAAARLLNARLNPSVAYRASFLSRNKRSRSDFVKKPQQNSPRPAASERDPSQAAQPALEANALKEFFAEAPLLLRKYRYFLQDIGRTKEVAARQSLLLQFAAATHRLKGMAGHPELLPARLLADALESLLRQLSAAKGSSVTASTQHTVIGAIDLLEELCRPAIRADLCTTPPIRILAADDDAISRQAISFALKKGLSEPDLANDGSAALARATGHYYDVIFLDVQMPGMDGFEVCSKIHQTERNRRTPVVFVTTLNEFEARAKSTALCGGNDLIAKPFLTFEIAVKALTLAMRSRLVKPETLETTIVQVEAAPATPVTSTASTQDQNERAGLALVETATQPPATSALESAVGTGSRTLSSALPAATSGIGTITRPQTPIADQHRAEAFATYIFGQMSNLRELIQSAIEATDSAARQEVLADLHRRVRLLRPYGTCPAFRPMHRVSAAMEALLQKLLEHAENIGPFSLHTLASALELFGELCDLGAAAALAGGPPSQLLVVADAPLTRSAIANGLLLEFGRPDTAASGEEALAFAVQKTYDVIFIDVQMPGMDGFAACAEINQTVANGQTPVVFVASESDAETCHAAARFGGSDFMTNPFLCSELNLKALTLTLRARLQRLKAEDVLSQRLTAALAE